jgi:hypothetical protein
VNSVFSLTQQIFTGNSDASGRSLNEIHPAFVAKYVRIRPMSFKNKMCMKVEVYGCNETVGKHINDVQGWQAFLPSYFSYFFLLFFNFPTFPIFY